MHAAANVSRETFSEPRSFSRSRYGNAKSVKGARMQQKLLDAAFALVAAGTLRPSSAEIAARANVRRNAVNEQFGYTAELYEALASDRFVDLRRVLGIPALLPLADQQRLVWLIVAGVEKPR
ncbi:hypothetical protein [Reyranella sp.]|uniref:hypothetical protein n=1 Tax=Reyranella sp. TaxID=1929291 RepID=UPI003C7EC69D